ncbi:MAG: aromatic ring-hydroxylating dioxygenase subunit alpha [Gammaproteobacteria bacterium]|nr:aromatic ring-hydroxylating dioxygenase subunit alpha [Gammaproteobacteria bacterium]MYF66252.1 aromatic ring-hydroxylating dioxygenase subunit alpha [Gammaproteobacteria bacterium]MYK38259.1 aromatic ring-hydroxylating dioxygenase subunit alpha [Gammaproteobacteria bacterium]
MYINLWYVASFSSELKDEPVKVRMLNRDFVLFRDGDGKAHCLSNVCPHRGVSLAQGKCFDDGTLQCPQHGWRFGGDGRCTSIPSQGDDFAMPPGARVDSYPTEERHGLIWTFLGDSPDTAPPIPDMPEIETPGWRTLEYGEVWNANYHWAKFANIDLTHVPIVHGQEFIGSFTPKENISRPDDYSISSHIRTPFEQPKGDWSEIREEQKHIASTLTFHVSGFTFKGHLEIGGEGSGIFATFYEMSTPIDSQTTAMRYLFTRNFMAEPEHDEGYMARNMKNVNEDRALAETQLPKNGPAPPGDRDLLIDPDDTMLKGYWEILGRLRDRGCEIDLAALEELDRGHRYCAIPSPARLTNPTAWTHDTVPLIQSVTNHPGKRKS